MVDWYRPCILKMLLDYISCVKDMLRDTDMSTLADDSKHFLERADSNELSPFMVHRHLSRNFEKGYGNSLIETSYLFETRIYAVNYVGIERIARLLNGLDGYSGPMGNSHCMEAEIRDYVIIQEKEELQAGILTVRVRFS